jgi:hypothetical protein
MRVTLLSFWAECLIVIHASNSSKELASFLSFLPSTTARRKWGVNPRSNYTGKSAHFLNMLEAVCSQSGFRRM